MAADTVGAPLSEFARLAMHHEPAMGVAVPGDLADQLACAGRRWDVPTGVAAAWLLAEGTARLLAAEETDPLDWRHTGLPHVAFLGPDGVDYSVDLQVDMPCAEMWVALRRLAKSFDADLQDIARIGLVWGLARLYDRDDGHDCATQRSANTTGGRRPPLGDSGGLDPQEAAVLAEVPLHARVDASGTQTGPGAVTAGVHRRLAAVHRPPLADPRVGYRDVASRRRCRNPHGPRTQTRHRVAEGPDPVGRSH